MTRSSLRLSVAANQPQSPVLQGCFGSQSRAPVEPVSPRIKRTPFVPSDCGIGWKVDSAWLIDAVMKIARIMMVTLLLTTVVGVSHGGEWIPMFNGRDLSGWRVNQIPEAFTVVDGAIKAHCRDAKQKSHLFYVGDRKEGLVRFKDFEFEATVRSEPGSNSGVFFHTDMTPRDAKHHLRNGYEVQLNSSQKEKRKTGSLYAIKDLSKSPVDETKWSKVRIRVQGKRIVVHLNDKQIIDYTEPANPERPKNREGRLLNPKGGAIALQGHDPNSMFYFKDLRIRRLD